MSNSPKSIFSINKKPIYDDEWIYDDQSCTSCGKAVSDHNSNQAVECALSLIKGVIQ